MVAEGARPEWVGGLAAAVVAPPDVADCCRTGAPLSLGRLETVVAALSWSLGLAPCFPNRLSGERLRDLDLDRLWRLACRGEVRRSRDPLRLPLYGERDRLRLEGLPGEFERSRLAAVPPVLPTAGEFERIRGTEERFAAAYGDLERSRLVVRDVGFVTGDLERSR